MPENRRALEFIERCKTLRTIEEIGTALFAELAAFGYAYVACSSHVDPMNPPFRAVSMCNYPLPWKMRFSEEDYAFIDPVYWLARGRGLPFSWEELLAQKDLTPKQRLILAEASQFGIAGGSTKPLHSPHALAASCSFVPGPDGVDPVAVPAVHTIALYAYENALAFAWGAQRPNAPILTRRQRQCLALVGIGKSFSVAGDILGIDERTVQTHVERAKKAYDVSDKTQVVVKALFDGQIRLDDMDP